MSDIKVRHRSIDVDIRAELEQFNWTRPRWTSDKLIAASPFRYDHRPSFFVRLEPYGDLPAGTWADSGAYDSEWASGNFVKLLAFLRNETYEETEDYLLAEYGQLNNDDGVKLVLPRLQVDQRRKYLDRKIIDEYQFNYHYLEGRGISEEVQRQANVMYDTKSKAVVIPWLDANGRLCNIKYRTTYSKTFWYHRGAVPVRELVYGIDTVTGPDVVLCEAEIDALSWRQAGYQAIAVGGVNFTDKQADIIKRANINLIFIAGDNDKAGRKFNDQVVSKLRGYVALRKVIWPNGVKDANEVLQMFGDTILQEIAIKSDYVDNFKHTANIFAV